jgi:hypothetical protein
MPVFCLFTLGRHGNFTSEQPDLLCTAHALKYYRVCRIRDVILELQIHHSYYLTIITYHVISHRY